MGAFREMRHYIKQKQQFVTQSEMRFVTAKVSEMIRPVRDKLLLGADIIYFNDFCDKMGNNA